MKVKVSSCTKYRPQIILPDISKFYFIFQNCHFFIKILIIRAVSVQRETICSSSVQAYQTLSHVLQLLTF